MNNNTKYIFDNGSGMHWFFSVIFLVLFLVGGLFVGQFFGLVLSFAFTDMTLNDLMGLVSPPLTRDKWLPIMLIQGMGALGGFVVGGILHLNLVERFPLSKLFTGRNTGIASLIIAAVLVISFMFVNTVFIEWNAGLSFPDFMKGFEEWAKTKEEELMRITEFLTVFDSGWQFLIGFMVIAVLPAFGEELIFRGILQNKLHAYFKNAHLAIWISAILFSGFHIQFYGFIPRLLLGGLFGYMYYWSRNLWYPIIGHFINNGLTLIMIYLYQAGYINVDIETEESYPISIIIIFALITFYMLFSFKRKVQKKIILGDE